MPGRTISPRPAAALLGLLSRASNAYYISRDNVRFCLWRVLLADMWHSFVPRLSPPAEGGLSPRDSTISVQSHPTRLAASYLV